MLHRRFWIPSRLRMRPGVRVLVVWAVVTALLVVVPSRGVADSRPPSFTVAVEEDTVSGNDWVPYSMVTITVVDPATNDAHTLSTSVSPTGWFAKPVGFDIKPGDIVTVTDPAHPDAYTKQLTVSDVEAEWISCPLNEAAGHAKFLDSNVEVWFDGDTSTKQASSVSWTYSKWHVHLRKDLVPGDVLDIQEVDSDGDSTLIKRTATVDADSDGLNDDVDNCPVRRNITQYDGDGDGTGSACDDVDRLWGKDRYETAAAVSRTMFDTADTVFIASGENFPDALVAAAVAGSFGVDAPVLLTTKMSLPHATRDEIIRLNPKKAYIVGGTAVISSAVEQKVRSLGPTVKRLAGANRYETSAAVSHEFFRPGGVIGVFIASGENFPDALVAAAAGGRNNAPVLLTARDHLPQATLDELVWLQPGVIYIVGGTAAISEDVADHLRSLCSGSLVVKRLAGANRYETAAAVAENVFSVPSEAFLAYGGNFPDALVAAAAAGHVRSPVLLVTHDTIPAATRHELDRLAPDNVRVVGGTAVIGDEVFNALP